MTFATVYSVFRPFQNHSRWISAKECPWYCSKRVDIKCTEKCS